MEYEDIRLNKQGKVATIMVDRPKVYNAIRHETMLEINHALDDIEADDTICVVVMTGAGDKAFVSGGDISVMAKGLSYVDTLGSVTKGQDVITRLEHFPKPVIARINGYALGGGSEIALGCDVRIASDNAVMGLPEITLGIIPGYGGTQRLPRLIGMGKAKELILTGDHISAKEALEIGLVNKVVSRDELDAEVEKIAQLARLHVDDSEAEEVAHRISDILELINKMQAVDTENIEPLSHPLDAVQRLRADEVTEDNRRDELQTIAPASEAGLYLVPKVIE